LVTYSQDGQLICSAPILPLSSYTNASGSKCRFMECADNSVFIVDLGTLSVFVMLFLFHSGLRTRSSAQADIVQHPCHWMHVATVQNSIFSIFFLSRMWDYRILGSR